MAKTITIVTQKGGVGKTTSTNALAAAYRKKGFRVLAVDMDPQCNLSFGMGADYKDAASVYHVLRNEVRCQFAIQHTAVTDIIASNFLLSSIEMDFTGKYRQYLLRQALKSIQDQYDYIFVDSPPGLGILTANALVAAQYVLIPTLADSYSLQGLTQLYETISYVRQNDNPCLEIAGVFLTQVRTSKLGAEMQRVAEMVCQSLSVPFLATKVRSSVSLAEAQNLQYNIMERKGKTNGAADYRALMEELLERGV